MNAKQYQVTLTGITPLIMHSDDIAFGEKTTAWRKDPANKGNSKAGDDRTPPWTWVGYTYHDEGVLGIPSDNLMTMLREAGAKLVKKGKETFKKQTQYGIVIDTMQWPILLGGKEVKIDSFQKLMDEDAAFEKYIKLAEHKGFELLVKRVCIGLGAKHIRVRPLFRNWVSTGTLTVLDEEKDGLTRDVLETILNQAGSIIGIGDWRPSSKSAGGRYGRFSVRIKEIG